MKKLSSRELRESYLRFFESRGHTVVPSSSLVPREDPTLLFTSAGMVQFKRNWATDDALAFARAVSCQKCVRAGGKDSDLNRIGKSERHHTFFEMLGNFSFGDYFKKEAIGWAFEYVTRVLEIPPGALYVSYYREDLETRSFWEEFLPSERLVALGEKDNFWGPAGDTGPCGPCTEMYYDFGPELACGRPDCGPGCDCSRYMEFWNLVFPQYDRQPDGSDRPLRRRGVDTGMGLERIARIVQGASSNYETDLFVPIIRRLQSLSGRDPEADPEQRIAFRVVADHLRTCCFLAADGILPSNEGRGYVLRRIIRRACMFGLNMGMTSPFLSRAADAVVDTMEAAYPSLGTGRGMVRDIILEEEEKFHAVIIPQMRKFRQFVESGEKISGGGIIPAETSFRYYGTSGLPIDLQEDIAAEMGMEIDREGFERLLAGERERARRASAFADQKEEVFRREPLRATEFLGHGRTEIRARAVAAFVDRRKGLAMVVLDRTVFYPEKGGQIGDRGVLETAAVRVRITDTQMDENGLIYHFGTVENGRAADLEADGTVTARVDTEFRREVAANHTATHLLHYALRRLVDPDARQAGSYVGNDRLRFDYICSREVGAEKIGEIERFVQDLVFENREVTTRETTVEEAIQEGAVALFVDRYGERVNVVSTGEYHREVCGGTHVDRTGDIMLFKIVAASSVGRNLKRIEAVTYRKAYEHLIGASALLERASRMLEVAPERLEQQIARMRNELERQQAAVRTFRDSVAGETARELAGKSVSLETRDGPVRVVAEETGIEELPVLGKIADNVIEQVGAGVVLLGGKQKGKLLLVLKVSEELSVRFPANRLMKDLMSLCGGGGGGSPEFAQGSGRDGSAFCRVRERLREMVGG